jgi:hypothetical protein
LYVQALTTCKSRGPGAANGKTDNKMGGIAFAAGRLWVLLFAIALGAFYMATAFMGASAARAQCAGPN